MPRVGCIWVGRWQRRAALAGQGWAPLHVKGSLWAFPNQGEQDLSTTGGQRLPDLFPQRPVLSAVCLFSSQGCLEGVLVAFEGRGLGCWLLAVLAPRVSHMPHGSPPEH